MAKKRDPDADRMLRAKQGDLHAFEELVDHYKQSVINLVSRTIGDPDEAEDLAQNVFVQAWKARHRYRPTAKFSTWLFTIARNLSLNEIRRRSRHPAASLDAPVAAGDDSPIRQIPDPEMGVPSDDVLRRELVAKIDEAIRALPENQRTALMLCREGDLSYEEIARVLDCSLSATKSLIHRARETLKQRVKPFLKTGEWPQEGKP